MRTLLARPERAGVLMEAIAEGTIPRAELSSSQVEFLRSHRDAALRERARALFPSEAENPAKRMEDARPVLALTGRPGKGKEIFLERCASCHQLGGLGHVMGPDLATAATAGEEKLLGSILDPNREVAPNYVQYDIETQDGESWSGIVASETSTSLVLRQANGVETTFLRRHIVGMRSQGRSPMPEDLTVGLSHEALADLLAFIAHPNPSE